MRDPLSNESHNGSQLADPVRLMVVERDALIEMIAVAFGDVTRADGVTLHEAGVIDSHGTDWERTQARLLDTDGCWQDIPESALQRRIGANCFLDAQGFRYYLPAYMTSDLRAFRALDDRPRSDLLFHLTHRGASASKQFWGLNDIQRSAVRRYLRFILDYGWEISAEDARRGLADYWERFRKIT